MTFLHPIAADWQKATPILALIGAIVWFLLFRGVASSEQAIFFALLVIYMLHQMEEHFWPGGFRQYANAHVFKSGNEDWPVTEGGVALVNIGFVWLPVAAAALFPGSLRLIGLAWVGLTFINAITHIVTSIRFRSYNPGLITSVVLFLPFTVWVFAQEHAAGRLTGADIAYLLVAGVLLHVPVALLFVVPFLRGRATA